MVTSFHSPEKKGRKEKGPPARRKIPVARTPGRVRSPVGASCAATGIFLMAGVTKPLIRRAANTVRRRKNEKGGSHCPPGPGAGPAHSGSCLSHSFRWSYKRITRLRTLFTHSSVSTLSLVTGGHLRGRLRLRTTVRIQGWLPKGKPTRPHRLCTAVNEVCGSASFNIKRKACGDGPEGAGTTFLKCTYTHFSRLSLHRLRIMRKHTRMAFQRKADTTFLKCE